MADKETKWRFGIVDALVIISIGLVSWNLRETLALKESDTKTEIELTSLSIRLSYLEIEKNKGSRFTALDGKLLESDISHIQNMFDRHAQRTEPKIDAIHEAVMNRYEPSR